MPRNSSHILAEKIQIPWYIMTSEATKGSTHHYFAKHDWFGLNQNDVIIFEQTMLPCLLPDGKIILESKHKVIIISHTMMSRENF